jgi:hypothetical protein
MLRASGYIVSVSITSAQLVAGIASVAQQRRGDHVAVDVSRTSTRRSRSRDLGGDQPARRGGPPHRVLLGGVDVGSRSYDG